jgi:hypothetical protein
MPRWAFREPNQEEPKRMALLVAVAAFVIQRQAGSSQIQLFPLITSLADSFYQESKSEEDFNSYKDPVKLVARLLELEVRIIKPPSSLSAEKYNCGLFASTEKDESREFAAVERYGSGPSLLTSMSTGQIKRHQKTVRAGQIQTLFSPVLNALLKHKHCSNDTCAELKRIRQDLSNDVYETPESIQVSYIIAWVILFVYS